MDPNEPNPPGPPPGEPDHELLPRPRARRGPRLHRENLHPRFPLPWLLGGLALGVLLGSLLMYGLASTERGQRQVLRFTLERIGRGIPGGNLSVSRVSGNLLTGARLYDVKLVSREGEPFLVADSADLDYDLRTLITPRIHIEKAVLYQPRIFVRRMPSDSLWNYEELFRDTSTVERAPGPERHTFLDSVRLVNARAVVQLPWEPTPGLSPRARRAEVAEVLADTSTILVQRVTGGYLRTVNFNALNGRFSGVRFAPGTPQGTYIKVDSVGGFAQVFRDPVRVTDLRGQILVLEGQVQFHAPHVRLRASKLGAAGRVRFPASAEEPLYDIAILGEDIAFGDLRWLYPRFPRDARGKLTLLVESRTPSGRDVLYLARDADVRAPGTRLRGNFGMVIGDTLRFMDVDVRADPLRVATIEAMLPEQLPVAGLRIGSAEIRGAANARAAPADTADADAGEEEEPAEERPAKRPAGETD